MQFLAMDTGARRVACPLKDVQLIAPIPASLLSKVQSSAAELRWIQTRLGTRRMEVLGDVTRYMRGSRVVLFECDQSKAYLVPLVLGIVELDAARAGEITTVIDGVIYELSSAAQILGHTSRSEAQVCS